MLLYDVSRSPSANRVGDAATVRESEATSPYRAGIPVFPKLNAERRSYDNVAKNASEAVHVLSEAGYAWISQKLVFVAFRGASFPTYSSYLAVVDTQGGNPTVSTFDIPKQSLLKPGENKDFIRVIKVVSDGSESVRLLLSQVEYGVSDLRVNIRNGQLLDNYATAAPEKHLLIPKGLKFVRVSEAAASATLLSQEYDVSQDVLGQEGTVSLEALIGKDGRVQDVRPISGPPALIPFAERLVRDRVYRGTTLNGEKVAVVTTVSINFGKQTAQ